jgi:hypothetical protein
LSYGASDSLKPIVLRPKRVQGRGGYDRDSLGQGAPVGAVPSKAAQPPQPHSWTVGAAGRRGLLTSKTHHGPIVRDCAWVGTWPLDGYHRRLEIHPAGDAKLADPVSAVASGLRAPRFSRFDLPRCRTRGLSTSRATV